MTRYAIIDKEGEIVRLFKRKEDAEYQSKLLNLTINKVIIWKKNI